MYIYVYIYIYICLSEFFRFFNSSEGGQDNRVHKARKSLLTRGNEFGPWNLFLSRERPNADVDLTLTLQRKGAILIVKEFISTIKNGT